MDILQVSFKNSISGKPKSNVKKSFQEALETQDLFAKSTGNFLKRMGITEIGTETGIVFMNGKLIEFNEDKVLYIFYVKITFIDFVFIKPWVHVLMPTLTEQTKVIQSMVGRKHFKFNENQLITIYILGL